MKDFKATLYESLIVAFGKILAKYNAFAQESILMDVGREIIHYLNHNGFKFEESGSIDDLSSLIELFVENGFVEKLDVESADKGDNYTWRNLYGLAAYNELQEITDNPFLSCPLNACLYYIAAKHNKTLKLHKKSFDMENKIAISQEEIVDRDTPTEEGFDSLIIENARLFELAQERADKLEKALKEIKTLRGILPICASCKKIRDSEGYWHQVEAYISDYSEASFTHGICDTCYEKTMKEFRGDGS